MRIPKWEWPCQIRTRQDAVCVRPQKPLPYGRGSDHPIAFSLTLGEALGF